MYYIQCKLLLEISALDYLIENYSLEIIESFAKCFKYVLPISPIFKKQA